MSSTFFKNKCKQETEIKLVYRKVRFYQEIVKRIEASATYQLINDEKHELMNRGYDEEEATKVAWFNRRFRLKKYLNDVLCETDSLMYQECSPKEKEQEELPAEANYEVAWKRSYKKQVEDFMTKRRCEQNEEDERLLRQLLPMEEQQH